MSPNQLLQLSGHRTFSKCDKVSPVAASAKPRRAVVRVEGRVQRSWAVSCKAPAHATGSRTFASVHPA